MTDSKAKQQELREALAELRRIEEEMENPRAYGMADVHEAVMTAYRKAYEALDFMWEVQREITTYPKPTNTEVDKISFARSVLTVMMETFDDEYYRLVEEAKDDSQELG